MKHAIIDYMVAQLGGLAAVKAGYEAAQPKPAPDPITEEVFELLDSNKGTVYSVFDVLEALSISSQNSAYKRLQKLVRAGRIRMARASYQVREYWIPDTDNYPVSCRDCKYFDNASRHYSFKDRSIEMPDDCDQCRGNYISHANHESNYCHSFRELTEAELVKQENEVFEVMRRMEETPYEVDYDDEPIVKRPKKMPWDINALTSEFAGHDWKQLKRIMGRLYAKGRIKESTTHRGPYWEVVETAPVTE